jgi:hypothetical protein
LGDLAEITSLKAGRAITSSTDSHGIGVFDPRSEIYKEILAVLRTCSSEVIARSRPDDTDSTGRNTIRND